VNALLTGEIDWLAGVPPDQLPAVQGHSHVVVEVIDPWGSYPVLRPNHVSGPTANAAVRRAIMAALDGREIIAAALGDAPGMVTAPIGVFAPGSPSENSAGMERLGPKPLTEVRAMLKQAGYANERLVLLHQRDIVTQDAMLQVIAKRLVEAGFNVDDQAMDFATTIKRRNSREAPDKGGWSLLLGVGSCVDSFSPVLNIGLRTGASAWVGWPDDPVMEDLRERWLVSTDAAEQKQLARGLQETALSDVLFVPLGRYQPSSAWRSNVSGILKMNMPIMWNVSKS
jgi:peptide/nickel transport system substrate-binding protein